MSNAENANSPPQESSRHLLKSTGIVSAMTLLSRILGLVRDQVFAMVFGVNAATDAFFVAFKIPNFLRRLFAEGAFAQAFVPVLTEYQSKGSAAAVRQLVDAVAGTLGMTLLVVTLVAVAGAPVLVWVFAPGFASEPAKQQLTMEMLRITFPYLFFISLTAFAGSILNSCRRFAVPAFTPVLLNLALIGAALASGALFAGERQVMALAWGVLFAGVLQLLFQLPALARVGLLPRPRLAPRDEGVRQIVQLMLPAMFGVSISQINLLLDTILASFLQTGSVSWLYYSDRLTELPLGVIGIAIATVILPSLSRRHAEQSAQAFSDTLDWGLRLVVMIGMPAAVALFVLAEPILATLFQYREFQVHDVSMAAMSLKAYSLGVLFFMLIKVLAPGYFARQDTRTPVRIGIIAMVANMALNLALVFWLAHVGLALATSLAAMLNAFLLWRGLRKTGVYRARAGWAGYGLRILLACSGMVAILWLLQWELAMDFTGRWHERVLWLALLVVSGLASYFGILWMLGVKPVLRRA